MIGKLRDLLAEQDMRLLDDLMKLNNPAKEPDGSEKSVKIRGLLIARNPMFICLRTGDMLIQIPGNSVVKAAKDPAPPALTEKKGIHVILEILEDTNILLFRRMNAKDLGNNVGTLPFVLSLPSQSTNYAVAVDAVAARNGARHQALHEKLTPIPFTPIEPLFDPNKSFLTPDDGTFTYTATSPYDTKETKWWNSPFETTSERYGAVTVSTDYKTDEGVYASTDANSDVKRAKTGGLLFNTSTAYDSTTLAVGTQEYETAQSKLENNKVVNFTVTDFHEVYKPETGSDFNSDVNEA